MRVGTRSRAALSATLAVALLALLPWAARPARAATLTVTTLDDAGAGSLRQAILAANASPDDDTIVFAPATDGGTILLASALPALADSGALSIVGNGATSTIVSGGRAVRALAVDAGATVRISGLTIRDGAAGSGSGGGIANSGDLTVVASRILSNEATNGAGLYNVGGASLTLINSLVSGNVGTIGGAVFNFGAALTIVNSTISGNGAATGGGIYTSGLGSLTLHNSILANSFSGGADCTSVSGSVSALSSLVEDGSCGVTSGAGGNLTGDPALNADLDLSAGSPARDAGADGLIPPSVTTDLAGNARSFGARVDMGAYEFGAGPVPPLPTPTPPTPTPPPSPSPGPARILMPIVARAAPPTPTPPPALPDLVVEALTIAPEQASYRAGEPVLLSVRVTNVGDGPATAFWVDLYLSPAAPPDAPSQRWDERCGIAPCYGLAWLVDGLAPGQSVTLTSRQPDPAQSIWPGSFAPGTSALYVYADSWNPGVATGGVRERDEANNLLARTGLSVTGASPNLAAAALPALPPRPRP